MAKKKEEEKVTKLPKANNTPAEKNGAPKSADSKKIIKKNGGKADNVTNLKGANTGDTKAHTPKITETKIDGSQVPHIKSDYLVKCKDGDSDNIFMVLFKDDHYVSMMDAKYTHVVIPTPEFNSNFYQFKNGAQTYKIDLGIYKVKEA